MTDTTVTPEELELRLGQVATEMYAATTAQVVALRAEYGLATPRAIPATGLIPDVVDGQLIESAWGNAIRDRALQRFDNLAALTAGWSAAPNGSHAVTLDNGYLYMRRAGAWVYASPTRIVGYAQPTPGAQLIGNAWTDVSGAAISFTAVAGNRYRVSGWANLYSNTGSGAFNLGIAAAAGAPVVSAGLTLAIGAYGLVNLTAMVTPTAGAATYKLQGIAPAGGLLGFNSVVYIDVLDFGPP